MIWAVSSSFSQMKYSRWMKRLAAARSCLRRANFWAPAGKISSVLAGSRRAPLSSRMVLATPMAAVSQYSCSKRSSAAALRSYTTSIFSCTRVGSPLPNAAAT